MVPMAVEMVVAAAVEVHTAAEMAMVVAMVVVTMGAAMVVVMLAEATSEVTLVVMVAAMELKAAQALVGPRELWRRYRRCNAIGPRPGHSQPTHPQA